jgi:UPF0271 protein
MKYLRRGSGYYIDIGASQLIIDGKIKLANGQVERLTENSVILDNGTELAADVIYQIGALQALAHAAGAVLSYVKPHGALYNTVVTDRGQARAVAEAVHACDPGMPVLGLTGSVLFEESRQLGLRTVAEAFADRAYLPDGRLVPRGTPEAVLADPGQIAQRVVGMVVSRTVTAVDGSEIPVEVESVCIHGDSPGAVTIARAVRDRLTATGVELAAFC